MGKKKLKNMIKFYNEEILNKNFIIKNREHKKDYIEYRFLPIENKRIVIGWIKNGEIKDYTISYEVPEVFSFLNNNSWIIIKNRKIIVEKYWKFQKINYICNVQSRLSTFF